MNRARSVNVAMRVAMAMALVACGTQAATNTGNPNGDGSAPDGIELVRSKLARDSAPAVPEQDLAAFGDSSRDFALDLYGQVKDADGNLFLSPYSIATALGMLYAGAKGQTKSEMMSALHFDLPEPELHAAFNATDLALSGRANELVNEDSSGDGMQLNVVNAAFGNRDAEFRAPFLDVLAQNYDTGIFATDFNGDPEGSRNAINDWVLEQTQDRIKNVVPDHAFDVPPVLVLVNAIYFKASWLDPFDPARTEGATFHGRLGDVQVQMMHGFAEQYAEGDGYQALALPYISPAVRMLFILPAQGRFEEIEAGMQREFVDSVRQALSTHSVDLKVPRFRVEAETNVQPALQALGLDLAFDPSAADLSAITGAPGDIYLSAIYHKAFVALDEQGTEAAAATALVVSGTSAPPPATFVLDRPFLFLIYDDPTGQILFVGRLSDPT